MGREKGMVRTIFLTLDNEKFERLLKLKGDKTWERLLVDDLLERESKKTRKPIHVEAK